MIATLTSDRQLVAFIAFFVVSWKLLKYWLIVGKTEPRQRRHQTHVSIRPRPRPYDWERES